MSQMTANSISLKSDSIVITGLGMVSPVGHSVHESCASSRAGIVRMGAIQNLNLLNPSSNEIEPVMGHIVSGITDGFVGLGRLVRLGYMALKDLLINTKISDWTNTAIFINLSSNFHIKKWQEKQASAVNDAYEESENNEEIPFNVEQVNKVYETWLLPTILKLVNIPIENSNQFVYFGDQTGVIQLVKKASECLVTGKFKYCIIGGIDSLIDIQLLEVLNDLKLLKTPANAMGIIPGECGAFILLEKYSEAKKRKTIISSIVGPSFMQSEPFNRFSNDIADGKALSGVVSDLINYYEQQSGLIIGNLNGDPYRAFEWGSALVRIKSNYPNIELSGWYPALSFGEIGAATGFTALCVASITFLRNAAIDNILIWLSNDDGSKGSLFLRSYKT